MLTKDFIFNNEEFGRTANYGRGSIHSTVFRSGKARVHIDYFRSEYAIFPESHVFDLWEEDGKCHIDMVTGFRDGIGAMLNELKAESSKGLSWSDVEWFLEKVEKYLE